MTVSSYDVILFIVLRRVCLLQVREGFVCKISNFKLICCAFNHNLSKVSKYRTNSLTLNYMFIKNLHVMAAITI